MALIKYSLSKNLTSKLTYSRSQFIKRFSSKVENIELSKNENGLIITPTERIRNFSIIAHVDHGKSTLADRLLEFTGAIKPGAENAQFLDQLQVERERGITVKAVTASLNYTYNDKPCLLNLIDTPGHVDFSNEVVRSVQACQGAILLVDAAEGPQAQTVAVHSLARRRGLSIIPVLNKIDLPRANPTRAKEQLKSLFKIDPADVLEVSAKKGWGVENLVRSIIERLPPPTVNRNGYLKALVFDTWYDKYKGVLCLAYVQEGILNIGDSVRWQSSAKHQTVKFLHLLTPGEKPVECVGAGQVAVFGCGARGGGAVGDILLSTKAPLDFIQKAESTEIKHMVYAGIFPADQSQYQNVQFAIEKLALNDSAVSVLIDSSPALGQGWRIGFLGLLHMEVFTQRLLQEHKAEAVISAPSVPYKVKIKGTPKVIKSYGGEIITITNPNSVPDKTFIDEFYEPYVIGTIITPLRFLGPVTGLCIEHRGKALPSTPIDDDNIMLQFQLPLCEVIVNFHDLLKSMTSGYASFDYHDDGFHASALTKLEILLNGDKIEELTSIVHVSRSQQTARRLVEKLKETIPRQMIFIAIQAKSDGRILARENLQAYRKDVTAKLYGGDVTRRKKLLKQQSEGKKEMRSTANIKIPRKTLIDVLKK